MESSAAWTALAFVSIASSSAFYTWVWHRPTGWKTLVAPRDPCSAMASVAHVLKLVQFTALAVCTDWATALAQPVWYWVLAIAVGALGQHLNTLVYHRLGVDGVYYGSRFGKSLPWVTAYPYNVWSDPQYVGAIITLAGGALVAPLEICLWWFANYVYLMWLESSVPTTPVDAPAKKTL